MIAIHAGGQVYANIVVVPEKTNTLEIKDVVYAAALVNAPVAMEREVIKYSLSVYSNFKAKAVLNNQMFNF